MLLKYNHYFRLYTEDYIFTVSNDDQARLKVINNLFNLIIY